MSDSDGQVVDNLGNLAVNAPVTMTVILQALDDGELTETASVFGAVQDPNTTNNTASVTTESRSCHRPCGPSRGIGDGRRGRRAIPICRDGDQQGPMTATDVVLNDTLPAGVSFVSATTDQGVVPTQAGSVVAVTFGNLGVGESATLTIVVNPTASPGSTLTDSASIAGQQADPNPSNNLAS